MVAGTIRSVPTREGSMEQDSTGVAGVEGSHRHRKTAAGVEGSHRHRKTAAGVEGSQRHPESVAGIDVSKHHLDVALRTGARARIPNTAAGLSELIAWLKAHAVTRVGLEASRSEERRVGKERRSRWSPY